MVSGAATAEIAATVMCSGQANGTHTAADKKIGDLQQWLKIRTDPIFLPCWNQKSKTSGKIRSKALNGRRQCRQG
jgi:ABC-type cobalt transport system substrate-binding protein